MSHSKAKEIVENIMIKFLYKLTSSDENVAACMAETNCIDWDFSNVQVAAWFNGHGKIKFSAKLHLSGSDHFPDSCFCGSEMEVVVQGDVATPRDSNQWQIQDYEILSTRITDF